MTDWLPYDCICDGEPMRIGITRLDVDRMRAVLASRRDETARAYFSATPDAELVRACEVWLRWWLEMRREKARRDETE